MSRRENPTGRVTAGDVVVRYLAVQVDRLRAADPQVRAAATDAAAVGGTATAGVDAVHRMRVAMRRLRSALAGYRPVFDPAVTEPLRAELAWLGGVLGPVRDLDVLRPWLAERLRADGHADMLLRAQVERQLVTRRSVALEEVRWVLDGERYARLLTALDALVSDPPLTELADRSAAKVLHRQVEKSWRRLRSAVGAARAPGLDPDTRALRLHDARKKAKRARYTAEVLRPLAGRPARRFVRAMKDLQTSLGTTQDGAVAVRELEGLAPGVDNAFALGRVQVLEQRRIAARSGALDQVWRSASDRRLRRWLR